MRVLWIDDDEAIRTYATRVLTTHRCHVETAATGRGGLEVIDTGRPFDVVILDHQLPDILGTDVLRAIRSSGNGVPVLYLTSYGTGPLGYEVGRFGRTTFKDKPLSGRDLVDAISEAFRLRQVGFAKSPIRRRELRSQNPLVAVLSARLQAQNLEPQSRHEVAAIMAQLLAHPDCSFFQLLGACEGLRCLATAGALEEVVPCILAACELALVRDATETLAVGQFLDLLASAGEDLQRLTEAMVATEMGIAPAKFLRWLSSTFRLSFSDCRRAMSVRIAALHLSNTTEPMKVIAFVLGYSHPKQMDRDFHAVLRMTPSTLRALLHDGRIPSDNYHIG